MKTPEVLNTKVCICNICDGLGYENNDKRYIGRALGKTVTLVKEYKNGLFVTDFFLGKDEKDCDYCSNGYLIVSYENFREMNRL